MKLARTPFVLITTIAIATSACSSSSDPESAETASTSSAAATSAQATSAEPAAAAATSVAASSAAASAAPAASPAGAETTAAGDASPAGQLAKAYAGYLGEPPTAPVTPAKDVTVFIVSCGAAIESCQAPSEASKQAAEALGWQASICDGKLNPQTWGACVRQGVSSKVDVIVTTGIDCPLITAPLADAKAAGITTVSTGFDCEVVGAPNMFSAAATGSFLEGTTEKEWWQKIGELQAAWVIGKTDGKAEVVKLRFPDAFWYKFVEEGFDAELKKCADCSVVKTLDVGNQDIAGGTLRTKFSTALLQAPTANAVVAPIDFWFVVGLGQAVAESGRSDKLATIGAIGPASAIGLIKADKGLDATVGFGLQQAGWASIDIAARALAKSEPVTQGVGMQVVDKEHNLPAAGAYAGPSDFVAAYKKAWGVS